MKIGDLDGEKKFFARAVTSNIDDVVELQVHVGDIDDLPIDVADRGIDLNSTRTTETGRKILDVILYGLRNFLSSDDNDDATKGDDNMADDNPKDVSQGDELFAGDANTRAWDTNLKRTYDEYQDIALTAARRSQVNFDSLNNVALQALQNAVSQSNVTNNQTLKHTSDTDAQKVRHADIAIENQWETGAEIAGEAVVAALAAAVAKILKE